MRKRQKEILAPICDFRVCRGVVFGRYSFVIPTYSEVSPIFRLTAEIGNRNAGRNCETGQSCNTGRGMDSEFSACQ